MKLDRTHAESLLGRIRGLKVAVLGDLMLDEYLFGEVNRISPEAPVPIVRVVRETAVLGGAANVAANLKALGAEPLLIGAVGSDPAGQRISKLLGRWGIGGEWIYEEPLISTIVKTRVIGQHQQMLRIDREDDVAQVGHTISAPVSSMLESALSQASALIISDYAKGVIGPLVMDEVRRFCSRHSIPWIVDPKPVHRELYRGATLMTPNTKETSELTGLPAKSDAEVTAAGRALMENLGLSGLLITRSDKGMALFAPHAKDGADHREPWMIPTMAQEVFDVSGAGDTVIAAFGAAVAAGADWADAAMLANAAAGLVVAKVGTATVTAEELLAHYHEQEAL